MALVRWDPLAELAGMEVHRLNRMFSDLHDEGLRSAWVPAVDIYETEGHEVVINAELPDMKREDISITVENDVLTLKGTRQFEQDVQRDRYHRLERHRGSFTRAFALAPTVDAGRIRATYRDGMLTIRLPQREEAKPKQIAIEAE